PREATVVSTTYVLAGLVESLSSDRLRVVQAHVPLEDCLRPDGTDEELDGCLDARIHAVLAQLGTDDLRFFLPARQSVIDPQGVDRFAPSLRRVANARGLLVDEVRFESATGAAQLALVHLHRP